KFFIVSYSVFCESLPPIPLKISYKERRGDSSVFLTLVCETAAFYPKNLTFTWSKNGTEITTGIHTTERQNTEGLFEASSSVEETQSVQNGTVYICRVSHISLQTPGIRNYTIYKFGCTWEPLIDVYIYSCLPTK
uniref:Ig-like domain-containing protein n=1 Tax=Callorhinchus milii TaxID=7868 RepID=A0A4W3IRD5_CALMI